MRAPLNSRVPSVNLPLKDKGKAKQESLERVPLEIQEALVLEDLLYVLMVCSPIFFSLGRMFIVSSLRVLKEPI